MPGCIVSATTASFRSVEKRRRRAMPVITSTFENVSDIGVSLGPPANAGVRSKRGALQVWEKRFPVNHIDFASKFRAPLMQTTVLTTRGGQGQSGFEPTAGMLCEWCASGASEGAALVCK